MQIRSLFRKQLPPCDHQRHHLIPVAVFSSRHFAIDFARVKRATGFDPSDFRTNGIFLPSTEIAAIKTKQPLHRGPHPRYSDAVAGQVAAIFRDKAGCSGDAIRQHGLLRNLQSSLYHSLSSNRCNIILNRRDPLARQVDFRCLDQDLAMLLEMPAEN
jgi:hypothetical protein